MPHAPMPHTPGHRQQGRGMGEPYHSCATATVGAPHGAHSSPLPPHPVIPPRPVNSAQTQTWTSRLVPAPATSRTTVTTPSVRRAPYAPDDDCLMTHPPAVSCAGISTMDCVCGVIHGPPPPPPRPHPRDVWPTCVVIQLRAAHMDHSCDLSLPLDHDV